MFGTFLDLVADNLNKIADKIRPKNPTRSPTFPHSRSAQGL